MLLNKILSNAVRFLSIDAIEKANSGHPGMPMGMAEIATTLWLKFMNYNPKNPYWINRDRFILSNGHGSILLYSLLYLTGYNISLQDLKNFRKFKSKTPGHPEYNLKYGIEATTGPLGQGLSNGIGMAIAEKILSITYNKKHLKIIDHYTYVFVGDGCLMEGISHEVCSLAGNLKLNKLIVIWDKNGISSDGSIKKWFSENVEQRYKAYGWNVIKNINGHSFSSIYKAIASAKLEKRKPSIICCSTIIGYGSPNKSNKNIIHSYPLGINETINTRKYLKWDYPAFYIPKEIYKIWNMSEIGQKKEEQWKSQVIKYKNLYPKNYMDLFNRISGIISEDVNKKIMEFANQSLTFNNSISTRKSSQMLLNKISPILKAILGGSSDLTFSNLTSYNKSKWVNNNFYKANYISYGARELGMAGIMNGISLHKGFKPYGGTFLVFSDYCKSAIRMSAIMKQPVIYIMTHDSILLGEDGPTHQPIEQLDGLRLIYNLDVWRPANTAETAIAWKASINQYYTPSVLILSRQNLEPVNYEDVNFSDIEKGGYLLKFHKNAKITFISTGSEISLVLQAYNKLMNNKIKSNIVSMPCVEKFLTQDDDYRNNIINQDIPALFVEASNSFVWYKMFPKKGGLFIGLKKYGISGNGEDIYKYFGFNIDNLMLQVKKII